MSLGTLYFRLSVYFGRVPHLFQFLNNGRLTTKLRLDLIWQVLYNPIITDAGTIEFLFIVLSLFPVQNERFLGGNFNVSS